MEFNSHMYNTVVNLYVKRKIQTKTLNTEVLNNSVPAISNVVQEQQQEHHQQQHQQQQQQQQQLQQFNTSLPTQQIIEDGPLAPPLPPRIVLQSQSLVQDLSSSGPGDVSLPGAPSLHTHSSKFPIEREVIVKRGSEKQCKIPNLSEYMRRAKPSVAPDAPPKQVAWVHKTETPMSLMDSSKDSEPSPIRPQSNHNAGEASGPTTSTPEDVGARGSGFPQRTYQSLKDIISSRFNNSNNPIPSKSNCSDTSMSPQTQLRQHGVYLANSVPQQPHEMHTLRHPHQLPLTQQQQHQQMLCGPYQPQTPQYKYHPMQASYQVTPNQQQQQQQQGYTAGIMETPVWKPYGNPTTEQHLPPPNDGQIIKCQSTENMFGAGCSGIENAYQGKQQIELASSVAKSFSQESIPTGQLYNMNKFNMAGPSNAAVSHQPFRGGRSHQQIARASGLALSQSAAMNCAELGASPSGHQYTTKQVTVHPVPPEQVEVKPPPPLPPTCNSSNQQNQQPTSTATSSVNKDQQQMSSAPPPIAPKPQIEDDDEGGFVKRGAQSDSGRGSTVYSSAKTSEDTTPPNVGDPEWADRVETELRNILSVPNAECGAVGDGGPGGGGGGGGSSESFSSMSPPLPPLSPQPSTDTDNYHRSNRHRMTGGVYGNKSNATSSLWTPRNKEKQSRSHKHNKLTSNLLSNALEIDSMLEENNSSEEDLEYTDTRAIRKQLEGLETMYAQVLKLLGVKKSAHGLLGSSRYEASDPRIAKRRVCGSVSSVPSSVSSRPLRDKRSQHRAKVRDIKGINKRFQRLESHVVTLARSVAHLSSEMRTQHIMMQEMEMMRGELAALRVQANLQQQQQQQQQCLPPQHITTKQPNSTPEKVKRLTKFFGDEPPLLRLFLRRLGYEKYANLFEKERIGLLELPFMTEERLHKLGIPLGPRLRIMQQAHLAAPNTLCVL